jgi:hypothetical protein
MTDPMPEQSERKKRVDRPYPRVTLENALRLPHQIKDKNGGNPWPPEEVAKALKVGVKTGTFWYLTAGARDYGLTEGTSRTSEITLTALADALSIRRRPKKLR